MNEKRWKAKWNKNICVIGLALAVGLIVLTLWSEHKVQFIEALPFLIFLLCPLMHIFMHKGHEKSHGHHRAGDDKDKKIID